MSATRSGLRRLTIFTGSSFVVSCLAWVAYLWIANQGGPGRGVGYGLIVVICGGLAAAMKMWRRDQNIAFNFITSIVCFVVPILALAFVGASALYLACYGQNPCD
ncbi:MAG TPA: hypothetical protein VGM36_10420 [Rhizomicrobium sp.]|jgi:uncharacterized membrane protein YiaA